MENRPAAGPATLPVGASLGSIPLEASAELAAGYLRDVRETDGLYAREGLVHPGTVLRMCNLALLRNVLLGPWIHVGSEVQNLSAARVGETLTARARVLANYERKGHLFVELDVLVAGDGMRPVAQVRHAAIYRPRQMVAA
jgi:hydrogenase maturation factor